MRHFSLRFLVCVLAIAAPAAAQQTLTLFPRFTLTGGGYLSDYGTQLRVDPHIEGLEGTTIDLEKNLGLDTSQTVTRIGMQWRPFQRHEFDLSYFQTKREGLRVIDHTIVYEDTTFPIQAQVQSKFNIDFWEATYTYWARQTPRTGLGINLGVTSMHINGELSASSNQNTALLSQDASTDLPVPVIGLEGRWLMTNSLVATARGEILPTVSIQDYEGSAYVGKFSLEYRPFQKFGIGMAYNYFNLNGLVEKPDYHADLGMTVSGLEAFVRFVLP